MSILRSWTSLLLAATLTLTPLTSQCQEYDLGSGCEFNDDGLGYEQSYCAPSFLELTLGLALSAAMILAAIAVANSGHSADDNNSEGGHAHAGG